MRRLAAFLLLLLAGFGLVSCHSPGARRAADPLILVSLDGFRWDYLDKYDAPTLRTLGSGGVRVRRLTASFPTKTFPNHYTLVTGLRPEHHGIVSNYFHDPTLPASFSKNLPSDNADPRWWALGEPLWITAEKQGLRSAVYFWPGGEAPNQGLRPSLHRTFDFRVPTNRRVDDVLAWLALPPAERPRFCALYLDVVDVVTHKSGPDAPAAAIAVKEADDAIARLLAGLERLGLRDRTNLVVVSDHGMSPQSLEKIVYLDDLVDLSQVEIESTGPNGGVRPKPGTGTAAELAARMRAKAPPQVQIYLREEIPARYQYRASPRIPPVVFIADEEWNVETKATVQKYAAKLDRGNHGWDPALPNMGALFVAQGPAFRPGVVIENAVNVDVYNLVCAVLGLRPAPNDGGPALARQALRP